MIQKTNVDLKPCPFCGNNGKEDTLEIQKTRRHRNFPYRVKCWSCGTKSDYCRTEEAAARAWNRRET